MLREHEIQVVLPDRAVNDPIQVGPARMHGAESVQQPLVAIVVLNWNSWADTRECVQSLLALEYKNYRVLIVDNASTDGSEQQLRLAFPDIAMVQTGANLGYAGGNNVGIWNSGDADYVLVVNPDVVLQPATLDILLEVAESTPNVGALSPVVRLLAEPETIWFAGGTIDWQEATVTHQIARVEEDPFQSSHWACGCCLLLSVSALREVGAFDGDYFMYFEETDLCMRLLEAGYRVGVAVHATAFHRPFGTIKAASPKFEYYFTRSRLKFFARHARSHGQSPIRVLWDMYRHYLFNRRVARLLVHRDPIAFARLWACVDFLLHRLGPSSRYP